ncbi:Uncharacterised protein [Chlamydia trachomatis]|nr:Uncharacterised protein [Chlamydia trachomatis]
MNEYAVNIVVLPSIVLIRKKPSVAKAIPKVSTVRKRNFKSNRPPMMLERIIPIIIGVMVDPAFVGETPKTPCMNSGTNMIAPNMPRPSRNPKIFVVEKTLFLKRDKSRIGSTALLSKMMNRTMKTMVLPKIKIDSSDNHSNLSPPKVKPSNNRTIPGIKVKIPR